MARADAERNHRQILDAALETFAARPTATLSDVATAAGVGRTTIHRHFPTRAALVDAVQLEALARVGVAWDGLETLEEAVPAVIGAEAAWRVLVAGPFPGDYGDARLLAAFDEMLRPLVALAKGGQARGELDPDVPAWWLADALFGLLSFALGRVSDGLIDEVEAERLTLRGWLALAARPADEGAEFGLGPAP